MKNISKSSGNGTRGFSPLQKIMITTISGILLNLGSYAVAATLQQSSFFRNNSVIIYGSQNKATEKDEAMIAYNLKKQMNSFINMSADNRLNENSLRNSNLVILAAAKSNNILNFTNYLQTDLPLIINNDSFAFGNTVYSAKKDGIALMYPSPFNAKNNILIYYSNSTEGLENLVNNAKIPYENDYQVINPEGKIVREGKFNKTGFTWKFDPKMDKDYLKMKKLNDSKNPNLLFLVKREISSPDSDIIIGSFTKHMINITSFSRIERERRYAPEDLSGKYRG
jgi:hypothetical protein